MWSHRLAASVLALALLPALLASPPARRGPGATPGAATPLAFGLRASAVTYRAPLDGPLDVLRRFTPPATRYGAGHLGVDLRVGADGVVRAAGAGEVTFAGVVAGRGVVVLAHADGVWTEYEPLAPAVRAGARVGAGQPLGRLVGAHRGCPGRCLHWGARRGDYFDPLALLRRLGPVVLLPWAAGGGGTPGRWSDVRPEVRSDVRSGPGMGPFVAAAQAFDRDVGVDLCRRQAGVSEDLLHGAQVGAALQEVGGRAVPQPVRPEVGSTGHSRGPPVHDRADRPRVDAGTADPDDEGGSGLRPS